ncbi:tetratricopeptide repeat protein [Nocardia donostiensis]|uniref:NB-ARC domain-containing protein n=1 Tax=Nocardia donostiensis TaxID=1538463 RepID=A0A1V2T9V5_9NOCA|nr:tetratricopeptide repeat protein [Nocardia donostiensis]ONM46292.1 hypothetical protein B0T46_23685 [Nocardia donostiensis]OQS18556.1 hypothetical protein B0T44_18845 [Nocardia donostiensis]
MQVGRDIVIHYTVVQQLASRPRVTATLPQDGVTFVGRDTELQVLLEAAAGARVMRIHTIDGMPGVGKTALVTRAAHRLAEKFPDGRYFVELHAHTPGRTPADPAEVLARLLTDLGIDPRFLPDTLEGRRDLWLDRVAGKRVLLVLDDAKDHAQIEPLLPTGANCLTLITSRRHLTALDGAYPLTLRVLDPETAAELFLTLARRTTDTDQAAVVEIVRLCGLLPLAIVLLAGRLAHHPTWTITGLADEFAATQARLDELQAGPRAVRAAFTMSYQELPPEQQRLFRCLGLHPGPDTDTRAAAALADLSVTVARTELEALYTDHLIEETQPGRYRLHDLLREYARDLANTDQPETTRRAVERLLNYYQATASAAGRYFAYRTRSTQSVAASPDDSVQEFGDEVEAWTWMRIERGNLLACLEHTAKHQPRRLVVLTGTLAGLLERDGPWPQAVDLHRRALVTARHLADRLGEADTLTNLGNVRELIGDRADAADLHRQALIIYRELGNQLGEADALTNLGIVYMRIGDHADAADLHRQALIIYRELDNRHGEARSLSNLGVVRGLTGDYADAADLYRRALVVFHELGDRFGEANALTNLGIVYRLIGNYADAAELCRQALVLYRELGDRVGEARALGNLGVIRGETGECAAAADLHRQALVLHREIGSRLGQANALANLGNVRRSVGAYPDAADLYRQALVLYRELGDRLGQANALDNLGVVHRLVGAHPDAADLHRQALALHREIGNRFGIANALDNLGVVYGSTGDLAGAEDLHRQALALHREIGNRLGEAEVLSQIGQLLLESGEPRNALEVFTDALALARAIHNPLKQARALEGAARCRVCLGDTVTAVTELREAVEIYRRLGAAEADPAAAHLATLESAPPAP